MKTFWAGFVKGAKETPKGYFAPAIAVWRLLVDTTDTLLAKKSDSTKICG